MEPVIDLSESPPDTPPDSPSGSPPPAAAQQPRIFGWNPPASPFPDEDLPLYQSIPNDFALAAFQTPQALDRLVQAFTQHDLHQAFGFRMDQGLRLHVVSSDSYRARSVPRVSEELQTPRGGSRNEVEAAAGSLVAAAKADKLEDTESDGSGTPTPVATTASKKKKKKQKKKDKGKAAMRETGVGEKVVEVEVGTSLAVVAAESTEPTSFINLDSPDSPDTARAASPIIPSPTSTIRDLEEEGTVSPEPRLPSIAEDKENVPLPKAEPERDMSSKFVNQTPSFTMALTPPPSPPLAQVDNDLEVDYPARTDFVPPFDTGLPTPPPTAAVLTTPEIRLVHPSPPRQTPDLAADIHPLDKSWTLFFSDTSDKSRHARRVSTPLASANAYSSGLFTIFTASTLEDLLGGWKALRRSISVSKKRPIEEIGEAIPQGLGGLGVWAMGDDNNFHLFVKGVKPMWEDPMCAKGGKLMFAGSGPQMDALFLDIVLFLIGGSIDDDCPAPPGSSSIISGATLSKRKINTRIEIWLGGLNAPEVEWVTRIQQLFARTFGYKLYPYRSFSDSKNNLTPEMR